jgi:hypothetical protein
MEPRTLIAYILIVLMVAAFASWIVLARRAANRRRYGHKRHPWV